MSSSSSTSSSPGLRLCYCKKTPCLQTSWTDDNPGRRFKGCENWKNGGCNFFRWFDPPMCPRSMVVIPELRREKIRVASENDQLRQKISSLLDEKMNLERTIANMGFENSNMARRLCSLQVWACCNWENIEGPCTVGLCTLKEVFEVVAAVLLRTTAAGLGGIPVVAPGNGYGGFGSKGKGYGGFGGGCRHLHLHQ
ncbi:hypothetical protein BUALT_Bualt18G0045000 [Buddleja alternifolia]|uniref:GRF-type domain-containing protein n=1 Tax=Buddleja alternifolia TaxID=168488 RepID=A0AAV6W4J4_9LAMI|nr:hypothetical protein BUALT_Bualt18G0045000 [Buddleja alternifolia]